MKPEMKNNILLKSALALAVVDSVLIVAILLQVNNLVKDVLELQNKQLEIGVMRKKLEKAMEARKQEIKVEEKETSKLDSSDWQEFSGLLASNEIEASFKFPPDWVVDKTLGGYALNRKTKDDRSESYGINIEGGMPMDPIVPDTFKEYFRDYVIQNRKEEILNFNNASVFKLSGRDHSNKNRSFYVWGESINGKNYLIKFMTGGYYPDIDEALILDTVISTFKLTKLATEELAAKIVSEMETVTLTTGNWKIYRNEKYGFALKYPPDWVADSTPYGPSDQHVLGLATPTMPFGGDWPMIVAILSGTIEDVLKNPPWSGLTIIGRKRYLLEDMTVEQVTRSNETKVFLVQHPKKSFIIEFNGFERFEGSTILSTLKFAD